MKTIRNTLSAIMIALFATSCATLNPVFLPDCGAISEIVLRDLIAKRTDWAAYHARADLPLLFVKASSAVTKTLQTEFSGLALYPARMMRYGDPHHIVVHRETGKKGAVLTVTSIDFSPFPGWEDLLHGPGPSLTRDDVDAIAFATVYEADLAVVRYIYLLKKNGKWSIVARRMGPIS